MSANGIVGNTEACNHIILQNDEMLVEHQLALWTRDLWMDKARQLLHEIGSGLISASAYDTAWMVRLIEQDSNLGGEALEWLCAHQLPEGSWGSPEPICYHDRIICTLSAMTAIARHGRRVQDR